MAKAKRIRDAESTENEVDRARYIIDHLDEVEDEVEYDEDDEYLDEDVYKRQIRQKQFLMKALMESDMESVPIISGKRMILM